MSVLNKIINKNTGKRVIYLRSCTVYDIYLLMLIKTLKENGYKIIIEIPTATFVNEYLKEFKKGRFSKSTSMRSDCMKIVHISQYYNDGYGYQENLLPYYQKLLGHEVVHITSDRMSAFVNNKARIIGVKEYVEETGVRLIRLPIKWEFKGRFVVFNGLYEMLEREKPDYIFHHGLTCPSLIECAKYKKRYPSTFLVADNHADLVISGRNKLWLKVYYEITWRYLLKYAVNYVDIVFGVTPLRCLFPVKFLGIPEKKVRLLPIGADVLNVPKENRDDIRRKYDISTEKLIFVTGGKITPEKQMSRILDAFSLLENHSTQLLVFGRVQDKEFEEKMKKLPNVKFMGWANRYKTLEILKLSDVAVWNSQHTTLIEDAVATCTPLILRYYGTTAHFIDGNGFYLYSNSIKELYEKMSIIANNEEILQKFREKAKEIMKILSYENIAKESIEYYYDQQPKAIHNKFMNEKYLDFQYQYFEKIH
ncbi:glycosyltransferase [Thermotoga sp. RQ7]|uniref:glycosyltransferase n=1 Tax=Thermotoga sp. RQ7 TaxID=126738 RepID=UPI000A00164F|nr:glycosyltransferase [Thermotoga sp. RQ7]